MFLFLFFFDTTFRPYPLSCTVVKGGTNANCAAANADLATCNAATASGGGGVAGNACVLNVNEISCDNVVVGAPAFIGMNPVTFSCDSDPANAQILDVMINKHKCCVTSDGMQGNSKCSKNWNYVCEDPTKWSGSTIPKQLGMLGPNDDKLSCDDLAYYLYANKEAKNQIGIDIGVGRNKLREICNDGNHDIEAQLVDGFLVDGKCCSSGSSICATVTAPMVQPENTTSNDIVGSGSQISTSSCVILATMVAMGLVFNH